MPKLYMEIQDIHNRLHQEIAKQLENEFKSSFETADNQWLIHNPIESISLHACSGSKPDSTIIRYYLIDVRQEETFVIKQQYFLESAEAMVRDFIT